MKNVTKASLILEIDGQMCVALLAGINLNLMTGAIAGLTESGLLSVIKLDDSFKWESLEGHFKKS